MLDTTRRNNHSAQANSIADVINDRLIIWSEEDGMRGFSYYCLVLLPIISIGLAIFHDPYIQDRRFILTLVLSLVSYVAVRIVIPKSIPSHLRRKLAGRDLNKGTDDLVPESMGLETCAVLIIALIAIAAFSDLSEHIYPAIVCVIVTTLLGFADDVLDIPWRVKFVIPFLTSLPLIIGYNGSTTICLKGFLAPLKSILKFECLDIGPFYLLYIVCLMVFCTHCINIYAGINGLEAGQAFVVACFLLFHSLSYWSSEPGSRVAAAILVPFIATTYGLLFFNWYPSKVFVGDTFTLTAGAIIATAGIMGHFAEMTLLFMIPQVINFVMSLPQILGFVPCARHRLPLLNKTTGKLEGQKRHWNLINWWLILFGPKTESRLCIELVIFQIVCCCCAYVIKYFYQQAMIP